MAEKTEKTLTGINGRQVALKEPIDKMVLQDSGSGGPFYALFALEGNDTINKLLSFCLSHQVSLL